MLFQVGILSCVPGHSKIILGSQNGWVHAPFESTIRRHLRVRITRGDVSRLLDHVPFFFADGAFLLSWICQPVGEFYSLNATQ
jgi:hypothetical protein